MGWLAIAVAMGVVDATPIEAQVPIVDNGVVVEEVGEGSALEKACLRPGDILHAWERLPAPPANPQGAQGTIKSVFEWMELMVEQAPRGTVKLTGLREGEVKVFEVVPGKWKATVRARMPEGMLEDYSRGKELIEAKEVGAGIDFWHKAAGATENQAVDGRLRCWLLLRIGDAWGAANQWEKAHSAYRSALEAAQDPRSKVTVWRAIGNAHQKASEFGTAHEAYNSAQKIREKTWNESLSLARGLNDLGILDKKQGKIDAAEDDHQRALEIRQKLAPDSLDVAASLSDLGGLAYYRGDLKRASEYFNGSLEIRQQLAPGSLDVAKSLNNLGVLALQRGELDRAIECFEKSLAISRKLAPGSLDVARTLHNLGVFAYDRGELDRAAKYYEKSLEIQRKVAPNNLDVVSTLTDNIGNLAYYRGNLDQAAEYYQRSLKIRQKLAPASLDVARSLNNLGVLASKRNDWDRATEYYEGSLKIRQKVAPNSLDVAKSLNNLGSLASKRGHWDRAAEYHEWSLEIRQKLAPGSHYVGESLNNLGISAYERADLDEATEYFERALEIRQKLSPGSLYVSESFHNLGFLAFARGDLDRAAEYYEGALQIRQTLAPGSSVEANTLHGLAILRRKQSQPQSAFTLFLKTLQALENQITKLGGSQDVQADFRAGRVAYYRDTIDLSLELQQPEEAFQILERSRARSFLAQFAERDLVFFDIPEELERQRRHIAWSYNETQEKITQLNPKEQWEEIEALLTQLRQIRWDREDVTEKIIKASPKLGSLRYPKPLKLVDVQKALDPGTVMLSYSIDEDETHLFVLTRNDKIQVETLPLGEKALQGEVERILELQKRRSTPHLYTTPLRQVGERLYRTLIQPAEGVIATSDRILIIPDGPLHLLPFALLVRKPTEKTHEDRDFEYLVEWKPLHTALSSTVYAELKNQRRSEKAENVLALAAFGDPEYASSDLRPLPHSREEVNRVVALYPEGVARGFLGAKATEEQAKSVGKSARILHFATHGKFDDRFPLNSYLALTIPTEFKKDQANGKLQAWEIFEDMRLDADLVVLSACESGLGEDIFGEGLKGLTRAFQFAGARTVAATLWKVEDRATAELMVRFYRHLRSGMPKDEALRAAQLELIRGPIEITDRQGQVVKRDFSAPYYWAAFQMIGDWQ